MVDSSTKNARLPASNPNTQCVICSAAVAGGSLHTEQPEFRPDIREIEVSRPLRTAKAAETYPRSSELAWEAQPRHQNRALESLCTLRAATGDGRAATHIPPSTFPAGPGDGGNQKMRRSGRSPPHDPFWALRILPGPVKPPRIVPWQPFETCRVGRKSPVSTAARPPLSPATTTSFRPRP